MSKIFIVTSGEYSDYGIRAVFSTEELAKQHIVQLNNREDAYDIASVEIWNVDEEVGKVSRLVYRCCSDGREWTYPTMALPELRTPEQHISEHSRFFFADSFVSAEHSRKLMYEEAQRRLRSKDE